MTETPDEAEASPPPSSTPARPSWRRPRGLALGWLALLVGLVVAVLLGPGSRSAGLALPNPVDTAVAELRAVLDGLPDQPIVIVGMDADLGTYAEIRPAVRAALDDLLQRGASLAFVSVTAEGRSLAAAEIERLRVAGTDSARALDLGYVAGVEAGLVRLVGSAVPSSATGPVADALRQRGGRLDAFDMALLIGGTDVGPRAWVEQVATRVSALPMVAIAPTFAQPELAPYRRSGQLAAVLATVREGAAYAEIMGGEGIGDRAPSALAMLAGMIAAIAVLVRQLLGALPAMRRRTTREHTDEDQS